MHQNETKSSRSRAAVGGPLGEPGGRVFYFDIEARAAFRSCFSIGRVQEGGCFSSYNMVASPHPEDFAASFIKFALCLLASNIFVMVFLQNKSVLYLGY